MEALVPGGALLLFGLRSGLVVKGFKGQGGDLDAVIARMVGHRLLAFIATRGGRGREQNGGRVGLGVERRDAAAAHS